MTNAIVQYTYEGTPISFSNQDGVMVNATQMAKPFGKRVADFLNTQQTKDFIDELADVRKIVSADLVRVVKGGNKQQGTWMHEDVALELARWLSPKFAIWCNDRIKELLMTGIAVMPNFENPAEAARAWATQYELREIAEKENLKLAARIETMEPKADYCDKVLQCADLVTTTQIAADYGLSAKAFNKVLSNLRVQRKVHGQWVLNADYLGKGYTQSKTHTYPTGDGDKSAMWTYWTQKGRLFVYETFKKDGILPLIER